MFQNFEKQEKKINYFLKEKKIIRFFHSDKKKFFFVGLV